MFYYITTFGCQMNVHESEKIAGILEKLGYISCNKIEDADVIVFNTCAIREGAQDRALGNIGALKKLKRENSTNFEKSKKKILKITQLDLNIFSSGKNKIKIKQKCYIYNFIYYLYFNNKYIKYNFRLLNIL